MTAHFVLSGIQSQPGQSHPAKTSSHTASVLLTGGYIAQKEVRVPFHARRRRSISLDLYHIANDRLSRCRHDPMYFMQSVSHEVPTWQMFRQLTIGSSLHNINLRLSEPALVSTTLLSLPIGTTIASAKRPATANARPYFSQLYASTRLLVHVLTLGMVQRDDPDGSFKDPGLAGFPLTIASVLAHMQFTTYHQCKFLSYRCGLPIDEFCYSSPFPLPELGP